MAAQSEITTPSKPHSSRRIPRIKALFAVEGTRPNVLKEVTPQINDMLLQSVVSTRKMNLLKYVQGMDAKDCRLYRQLLGNINIFLGVKDSIRLLNIQEEMVKKDLMQCIQDNWKTRRNLNVGPNNNHK